MTSLIHAYPKGYSLAHEDVLSDAGIDAWLSALRDPIGKARIVERIRSAEHGNFGDCESVGNGISEMRVHCGPGYRVYFSRIGTVTYLLLCAGDKTTQKRDIRRAHAIRKNLET